HAWASEEYRRVWSEWRTAVKTGTADAWEPYVVSTRAWWMLAAYEKLVAGTSYDEAYLDDLAAHLQVVKASLEFDVGGNHLMRNLKAMVGLAIFLGDEDAVGRARGYLSSQLREQVLADGGHYERSPSYHCQVLTD